jgi:hypothetical protein
VTFERDRLFRAVLTCTTCRTTVAIGPIADYEPRAAYELGLMGRALGVHHLGTCAGGALEVTIEEVPGRTPPSPGSKPARLVVVK